MNFEPNAIYHIYNQGNNQRQLFYSRENYLFFLRKMRKHILPYGDMLCYCLMPNHFHWMVYMKEIEVEIPKRKEQKYQGATGLHPVKLRDFNQSIGILLRSYTRAINKEMNWSGSLFRNETKVIPLINDKLKTLNNKNLYQPDYSETYFQYIHENPVKAK